MTTSEDQEMNSGPNVDPRESMTIPNRKIKEDSQTCLKTLSNKTQEFFYKKKDMLKSNLGYKLL
jgi:hypothetical protein